MPDLEAAMEWLTNSDHGAQPLSNVNYHWHTPDFIPKKQLRFLDVPHQETCPSDSKDSGMTV
ncbi:hypothetical protein, partial [Hoeflea sp.]|uniref:hypothetical protein n=1 Tax=Hoeflea sp. TaxID=1940281 RepID=UPI0025BD6E1A